MMPLAGNELFYMILLHGFALFITSLLIQTPLAFLIEAVYKKNSNTFKTFLIGVVLACCSLYYQILCLDF